MPLCSAPFWFKSSAAAPFKTFSLRAARGHSSELGCESTEPFNQELRCELVRGFPESVRTFFCNMQAVHTKDWPNATREEPGAESQHVLNSDEESRKDRLKEARVASPDAHLRVSGAAPQVSGGAGDVEMPEALDKPNAAAQADNVRAAKVSRMPSASHSETAIGEPQIRDNDAYSQDAVDLVKLEMHGDTTLPEVVAKIASIGAFKSPFESEIVATLPEASSFADELVDLEGLWSAELDGVLDKFGACGEHNPGKLLAEIQLVLRAAWGQPSGTLRDQRKAVKEAVDSAERVANERMQAEKVAAQKHRQKMLEMQKHHLQCFDGTLGPEEQQRAVHEEAKYGKPAGKFSSSSAAQAPDADNAARRGRGSEPARGRARDKFDSSTQSSRKPSPEEKAKKSKKKKRKTTKRSKGKKRRRPSTSSSSSSSSSSSNVKKTLHSAIKSLKQDNADMRANNASMLARMDRLTEKLNKNDQAGAGVSNVVQGVASALQNAFQLSQVNLLVLAKTVWLPRPRLEELPLSPTSHWSCHSTRLT